MATFFFVIAYPEPKSFNHALVAEPALDAKVTECYGVPAKVPA
jgi:hypothetical protein